MAPMDAAQQAGEGGLSLPLTGDAPRGATAEPPPLARDELQALLHLRLLPRLNDVKLRALLQEYGSAPALLAAGGQVLGDAAVAARRNPALLERVRRGVTEIERLGLATFVVDRPGYPARLLDLHDPPCLLFARGRLELLDGRMMAIVGSRRHTQYGADAAERLARELGELGFVIVSGLARGVDGIAHRAALETGTVAVLGSGIDVPYPRENLRLHHRIVEEGLLLSEFPPGTPPLKHHFPQRNRIIAALAEVVILVEATADSGSLITADHALDMEPPRDVFAVPGPIGRDTSAGTNAMIQEGAALVTCAADVLDELNRLQEGRPQHTWGGARRRAEQSAQRYLPLEGAAHAPEELTAPAAALFRALTAAPRHVDELAAACSLPPATALAELLALELMGHARQLPGARFVRA